MTIKKASCHFHIVLANDDRRIFNIDWLIILALILLCIKFQVWEPIHKKRPPAKIKSPLLYMRQTGIITLVLLPIYFVYSSVSIYRTFTRFIGQCPVWLAVSTLLNSIWKCTLVWLYLYTHTHTQSRRMLFKSTTVINHFTFTLTQRQTKAIGFQIWINRSVKSTKVSLYMYM